MIGKPLENIAEQDLLGLISNQVVEGKSLEYKRDLPGGTEEDRRKLLRAICALANTAGGDLIFGVEAADGVPVAIPGIAVDSEDALRLRIENACRDGIEPRLPALHMKLVELSAGTTALVVRVPKSWNAPHRLSADGHFYGRNSSGGYRLDVGEIRRAFTLSETVSERIRAFRAERLIKIEAGQTPVPILDHGAMVLHVMPLAAFAFGGPVRLDFNPNERGAFNPLGCLGWSCNINLDGFVLYSNRGGASNAYTQVFRSGVIEAVAVFEPYNGESSLSTTWNEEQAMVALTSYTKALVAKEVELPLYVFLSFLKVGGYRLYTSDRSIPRMSDRVDRDTLILPETVIETPDFDAAALMRPAFDMTWNAFGFERCFNYDDEGRWRAG